MVFANGAADSGAGSLLHTDMRQTGEAPQVPVVGDPVRPPVTVDIETRRPPGKHQHTNTPARRPCSRFHRRPFAPLTTLDMFIMGFLNERPNRITGPGITPQRRQGGAEHLGIVPGPGIAGDCRGLKVRFSIGIVPGRGCGSKVCRIRVSAVFGAKTHT